MLAVSPPGAGPAPDRPTEPVATHPRRCLYAGAWSPAGGMSHVFVATDASLGRQIVVKVLPPDAVAAVSVDRFKREIQVAASLQHPHIVPLLAAGDANGIPFYTMPYVRVSPSAHDCRKHGELRVNESASHSARRRLGARLRARRGRRPPRHQTGERHSVGRGRRRHRLRHRQGDGQLDRRTTTGADDFTRRRTGNARLHGTGASDRRSGRRSPRRHLLVRLRRVRDAHRLESVRRAVAATTSRRARHRGAGATRRATTRPFRRRWRASGDAVSREASRPIVRNRRAS